MSIFNRLRNVSPSGEYSKLPNYTPVQSPPFPAIDHESKTPYFLNLPLPTRRSISTHCQPPTRRQFIYSTIYAITLAVVAVLVTQFVWPLEPTYYQWLRTRMGREDPFDELRLLNGPGSGNVGRAMWGLHEETGWDRAAVLEANGFVPLDDGERYFIHHNTSEAGSIE